MAAQPLYKLKKKDWKIWLDRIETFCEREETSCYAENAFNEVSDQCLIRPLDVEDSLCAEIDNPDDLKHVSARLKEVENRMVYMCFSADMIHSGHIAIIRKAARLGKLIIGVLSDEAVISYKRYPLLPYTERKALFENIRGVSCVVEQKTLSYRENLEKYKPDYVVHGDDSVTGFQKPVREEVLEILKTYGGKLVEFPSIPEMRNTKHWKIVQELIFPCGCTPGTFEKSHCHERHDQCTGGPQWSYRTHCREIR